MVTALNPEIHLVKSKESLRLTHKLSWLWFRFRYRNKPRRKLWDRTVHKAK